jgi:hypothetical protein
MLSPLRIGNFTSSGAHRLMNPKKVATYVKEKRRERRLGIEIGMDTSSYATAWGKAMEGYVFSNHLDTSFILTSTTSLESDSKKLVGTPDIWSETENCVGDIKCPFTRSSFCDLVEIIEHCGVLEMEEKGGVWVCKEQSKLLVFKEENPEYYWQLVSNSILAETKFAELVVWMPYVEEIPKCKSYVELIDDFQVQKDMYWLDAADIDRIPCIPNDSGYKNVYKLRFEVPDSDKKNLLSSVDNNYEKLIA